MNHETTDARRTDQDIYNDVIKANQNMNHQTRDTPETDGKIKRICGNWNNAGDRVQDFVLADIARKLERERDRMQALAGELIAMIRVNVMRSTFDGVSIEQMDDHLKPWVERLKSQ